MNILLIFYNKARNMSKESKKDYDYMFKLILVGSASVGKSNILLKYTKDQFNENSQNTIGVEYATKTIETKNGTRVKFQIWDTAGQEQYRALMKTYYKGSSAAIIVYDITRQQTFLNLDQEQKLIKDFLKTDIITMIVGNKIDLEEKRVVSKQSGLDYAESKKIAFYQVSAKDGTNINLIFTRIAQELEKAIAQPPPPGGEQKKQHQKQPTQQKQQDYIVLSKANEEVRRSEVRQQKKKCCS